MKQHPSFRRQSFTQRADAGVAAAEADCECMYLRLSGSPGEVLDQQRVRLSAGGMLDLVADANEGTGIGRVAYSPGLRAALKRRAGRFTYRFEVPETAAPGSFYVVTVHGTDRSAAFRFAIEVGSR